MLKTAICTISSTSHLFKAQALFSSLKDKTSATFYCLLTDGDPQQSYTNECTVQHLSHLSSPEAQRMCKKYSGDQLRWGLKSLYLLQLLKEGYEAVIYVDNDIFFYSSPDFLFEQLKTSNILLTPHFYPTHPDHDQNWLEANYKVGIFNAGFIGVNQAASNMLNWWAGCCLYNIKKSFSRGLFDDQKYLDVVPAIFDGVEIVKHKGCNVAGWNLVSSPRSLDADGKIMLDSRWELIFIHYNYYTLQCIANGKDPVLKNPFEIYHSCLLKYFPQYQLKADIRSVSRDFYQYFQYIRYRLLRWLE
jgi:hypothetical protein